jgi:hypothetical protein
MSFITTPRISGMASPVAAGGTGALTFNLATFPAMVTVTLTGAATLVSGVNYYAGAGLTARLYPSTSGCTLAFPSNWHFLTSPAPSSITSGKYSILNVQCFEASDTGVLCSFASEA